MNLLHHTATTITICSESLTNASAADHEKWVKKLGGGDNETAKCVKENLNNLNLIDALECSVHIVNKSDMDVEPDEKAIRTEAIAWAEENYKDQLEGNVTLQNEVKICGSEKAPEGVEEKYSVDDFGAKFDGPKKMATNTHFNAYIVVAGVGMLLAGVVYRYASKRTDMDNDEQESVLLE